MQTKTPDFSSFDLTHLNRTSFDMGNLIPIANIATLPSDRINVNVEAFVRGMPTIAPIIDKVDIKINHFYVPYRVLWNKFEDFISMSDTYALLGDAKPTIPNIKVATALGTGEYLKYPHGRLADYMGVPSGLLDPAGASPLNALHFLAYQKIYLDYYAPQRWVEYLTTQNTAHPLAQLKKQLEQVRNGSGGNIGNLVGSEFGKLRKVGWNHDYFTNALPTPQLFEDVKIPILHEGLEVYDQYLKTDAGGFMPLSAGDPLGNNAKLAGIRDLRKSVALQHYLEKMQVGGGRYLETMQVVWGQKLSNSTLQRSQYLGGDVIPLFVNEVESQASTEQRDLGDLAGKPIGAGHFNNINFTADEFGVYMAIAHVVPKRSYTDTLDRNFMIKEPLDFPVPEFENIGDQAVFVSELHGQEYSEQDSSVFGYVPRYSQYKGMLDRFSGEMRNSLKHWHLGSTVQDLSPYNEITPEFIECNPREDIFQVNEPDKLLGTFKINCHAKRKLQINPTGGISRI